MPHLFNIIIVAYIIALLNIEECTFNYVLFLTHIQINGILR